MNMSNAETYTVRTEKLVKKPVADVFHALSEGLLFLNCGSDSQNMKIDFRVGGKYQITFKSYGLENYGEFVEIVPNKKIAFTWCQSFEEPRSPDTLVTIELSGDQNQTKLSLVHTGFRTKDICDSHQGGWDSGLKDMTQELEEGTLRMLRMFEVPVAKLYETCKNPQVFFGLIGKVEASAEASVGGKFKVQTPRPSEVTGDFVTVEENKKMVFNWLSTCEESGGVQTKVTFLFDDEEDDGSSVEIIHEGLANEKMKKSIRAGWDFVFGALAEKLKK
jgi:uncharacterized protein YndB with AHSA1/START domain